MSMSWRILTRSVLSCGQGSMAASVPSVSFGLNSVCNNFHTTQVTEVGQEWRKKRGMPSNPNSYGPLTDGPDYSFVDGRPTPPGSGKVKRALKQHELATKVMELTGEVDFAVDFHKRKVVDSLEKKHQLLDRKLKPKGRPESK